MICSPGFSRACTNAFNAFVMSGFDMLCAAFRPCFHAPTHGSSGVHLRRNEYRNYLIFIPFPPPLFLFLMCNLEGESGMWPAGQ